MDLAGDGITILNAAASPSPTSVAERIVVLQQASIAAFTKR